MDRELTFSHLQRAVRPTQPLQSHPRWHPCPDGLPGFYTRKEKETSEPLWLARSYLTGDGGWGSQMDPELTNPPEQATYSALLEQPLQCLSQPAATLLARARVMYARQVVRRTIFAVGVVVIVVVERRGFGSVWR